MRLAPTFSPVSLARNSWAIRQQMTCWNVSRRVQRNSSLRTWSPCRWMVIWKLVELIQKEYGEQFAGAQLEIVGSCGLHTLHNSFKSGFLMWQIEKVLRALHSLFNCAPARREDFSSATKSSVFPLPFCGHRWLENLLAIERAVEVWPSIVKYVDLVKTKKLPNPGSSSYDTIAVARMDPLLLAKFHFFMAISRVFQPFLTKYQTDAPMMPFLWNDLENLIKELSGAKSSVNEHGVLQFQKDCEIALSSICKKALDKCPLKYSIVRNMMCLDPNKMYSKPDECLQKMRCLIQKFVQDNQLTGGISAGKL
ncbi:hypothetical protein MHYP_G00018220 [Metynnis hypsauchen]